MASLTRTTALARPLRTLIAARSFSTSISCMEASRPTTKHVHPADVVAGAAPGPLTLHETPTQITADVVSDAPASLRYRTARIYKPTKTTMQSAKGKTRRWLIDWDVLQGAGRWENPLMGWASSGDYMQGTQMSFPTKEEAIAFVRILLAWIGIEGGAADSQAEKQGWAYQVQTPHEPKIPAKNYANNYVHVPGKLRICHTK